MSEAERTTFGLLLAFIGIAGVGFGAWLIIKGRLPTWMKGIWKWPAGDNLTPTVVRTMGWANIVAAAACVPAIVLLVIGNLSLGALLAAMAAMFFAGAATFALVWSVVVSRSKPA